MRVRNVSKATRVFPSNVSLDPNEAGEVDDADFDHPVIKGWIDDGHIVADDDGEEGEEGGEKEPSNSNVSLDPNEAGEVDDADFDHPVIEGWIDDGHIVADDDGEEGEEGGEKEPSKKPKSKAK